MEFMNEYIKRFPKEASFKQKGFDGYNCNLECKKISITLEDVYKGHEKYAMNTKSYHIYYVAQGSGTFKIGNKMYNVTEGDIVEIPPNTEFVFKGKMKLLLIMNPPFDEKNDITGKENDIY